MPLRTIRLANVDFGLAEHLNDLMNDSYASGKRAILLEWFLFDTQRALLTQNATISSLALSRLTLVLDLHEALEFGGRVSSAEIQAGWPASPDLIRVGESADVEDLIFKGSIKRYWAHERLWYSEAPENKLSGAGQAVLVNFYQLGSWVLDQDNITSSDLTDLIVIASELRIVMNADTSYYIDELRAMLDRLLIGTNLTIILFFTGWAAVFIFIVTPTLRDLNTQLYRTRFLCTLIPYNILKDLPLFLEKFSNFALAT